MDRLFSREIEKLVSAINSLSPKEDEEIQRKDRKTIQEIGNIARRLDTIYSIAVNGFEYVNGRVSNSLYEVSNRLIVELEDKELLIEEAEEIVSTKEIEVQDIIEYGRMLSINSKCPLLWNEEMPLDRLPAYPIDSLIQQSVLRMQDRPKEE